ncbi:MAG: hypothetical protein ABH837_01740 [bacterium]
MKMNKIQKSVLSTLVFFDIFDRPLTFEELHLYLYKAKASEEILQKELRELISKGKVGKLGDWYFLPGRLKFLQEYPARLQLTKKLINKVQKKLWYLKNVPFIKMIAIVNSVAFSTVQKDSDIDIFVITSKNRIYTVRFFLIRYLKLLGVYPKTETKQDLAGKVCASYYVDSTHISLNDIRLKNIDDVYLDYWLISLNPFYGQNYYQELIKSNQDIVKKFPNFNYKLKYKISGWNYSDNESKSLFTELIEWFFCGLIGHLIENRIFRYYTQQLQKLLYGQPGFPMSTIKKNVLKLHGRNDRRQEIAKIFVEKTKKFEE